MYYKYKITIEHYNNTNKNQKIKDNIKKIYEEKDTNIMQNDVNFKFNH